jgi:hypothetical protein
MSDQDNFVSTLTIMEVLNRYFAALDQKEFDLGTMGRIFSDDAKIVRPNGSATVGPQAIGESHAQSLSHFQATQHLVSGFIITPVSDTEARFRANLVAMHVWAEGEGDPDVDPNENYFLAGGVITGRVILLANGWHIAELANQVVWRHGVGFQQMLNMFKTNMSDRQ